jgi:hypothetical protein
MAYKPISWHKYKPGTPKLWLYLAAGLVWMAVGIMLIGFASHWLRAVSFPAWILYAIIGIGLAGGIYLFGFSKLAKKNIDRIFSLADGRICLFAFQEWKSYPLVVFMVALGIYLRIYSPVPKPLLAILYLGIGGGLALSSLHYFLKAFQKRGSSATQSTEGC